MKIYIYYKTTNGPYGGANSFIKCFKRIIEEKKTFPLHLAPSINGEYDIFLVNSGSLGQGKLIDIRKIEKIKRYGTTSLTKRIIGKKMQKKIVCRLDGLRTLYTKSNTLDAMDALQLKVINLADHIIFQSRHSLESFKHFEFNKRNYSIVRNGVDQTIFNTNNKIFWSKINKLKVLSANWSSNLHKGYKTISEFSKSKCLDNYFVGNWNAEVNSSNISITPPIKQEQLADHYKRCDVFLHAAENDPCPNVVLEALSCGLPIIYHNSGGTPEIAKEYGVPLPEKVNAQTVQKTIEKVAERYDELVSRLINDKKKFSINFAAERYFDIFEKVLNNENI